MQGVAPSSDDRTDELFAVSICKEYGWTYEQFLDQPQWFIETHNLMKSIEAKHTKK